MSHHGAQEEFRLGWGTPRWVCCAATTRTTPRSSPAFMVATGWRGLSDQREAENGVSSVRQEASETRLAGFEPASAPPEGASISELAHRRRQVAHRRVVFLCSGRALRSPGPEQCGAESAGGFRSARQVAFHPYQKSQGVVARVWKERERTVRALSAACAGGRAWGSTPCSRRGGPRRA